MSKFSVAKEGGPKISADDAASRTFGIVGQRGTGKSSVAALLVEGLVDEGARAVVCDPTGVWWGLAHAGTGPGLKNTVILGGEHQNAPLEETGGQVVADLVTSSDYSVVILDMKLLRKAAQVRLMADFLEALYHQNRDALTVVMDEAGRFAPQKVYQTKDGGPVTRLLGAIEDVVKLGRSRGLGAMLVEQRPAHISKSVFEQIETLIAMRLMGPNDRRAISDWIEAQGDPAREKEVMDAVAKFGTGTGLLWSPAFLDFFGVLDFRFPRTYDSRRTPKPGERRKAPGERAAVDLASITEQMAASIERAKQEDPKHLRTEIARLKKELAAKPVHVAAEPKRVEVPVLKLDVADRLVVAADKMRAVGEREHALAEKHQARADAFVQRADAIVATLKGGQERAAAAQSPKSVALPVRIPSKSATAPRVMPRRATAPVEGDVTLKKGARAMLVALARFPGQWLPRGRIAMLAGLSPQSGTFSDYLSSLRTAGYMEDGNDGRLLATDAGLAAAGDVGPPDSSDSLMALWLPKLKAGARRMIAVLFGARETWITREDLGKAAEISPASGTFSDYLSSLRTAGLLEEQRGLLRISQDLFVGDAA